MKNTESTVKKIATTILVAGIAVSAILIIAGFFMNQSYRFELEDVNGYLILSGIFSLLFVTLPLWSVLTMLFTISNKLGVNESEMYTTPTGTIFKIGDKLELGKPQGDIDAYTYVKEMDKETRMDLSSSGYKSLKGKKEGWVYEITDVVMINDREWAEMKAKSVNATVFVDIDNALQHGELIGFVYTSDAALQELKKWKDKLDFGLITKEIYEIKKTELSKYIK